MSGFLEYEQYDGLGLAELVRSKQVTPAELVEAAIQRIERHNPRLNAVVYTLYDQARSVAQGRLPDGPFHGVPFLLKDLIATVAGVPTGCGNRLLKNIPATHDSELVERFKAAGVIILGKTNTPEFGLVPYTEPEATGVTSNPGISAARRAVRAAGRPPPWPPGSCRWPAAGTGGGPFEFRPPVAGSSG